MKKIVSTIGIVVVTMLILTWVRNGRKLEQCAIPDELIVATSADFAPFSFMKGNDIIGFDVDVITEVAQRLHKKVVVKDMPFDVLVAQLRLGQIHIIAAALGVTPERQEHVQFTTPYIGNDPFVLITRKGTPAVTKLDALRGKKVAVSRGHTTESYVAAYPTVTMERMGTLEEAIKELLAGAVEGVVTQLHTVKPLFERHGDDQFSVVELPDHLETMAFAVAKERLPLLQEMNRALAAMQADGTLDVLKQKWHLA